MDHTRRRTPTVISATFLAACGCGAGAAVVFWLNADIQLEGLFFGLTFLLLAVGLVLWSHHLLPEGPFEEKFPDLQSSARSEADVLASMDRGGVGRRRVMLGVLGLAGGSVVAGLASTVRGLGPAPYSLTHTAWRGGKILTTSDGAPVHADDVPVRGIVTVFPLGFTNSPEVLAMLIHLAPGLNRPLPGRESWAPDDFICYSKVCSHAGCPVNLFNGETWELQCPCHQSTFNVLHGAEPVFGPAGGPLAQLPIAIDADGVVRSTGDFASPPGPVFWHHS